MKVTCRNCGKHFDYDTYTGLCPKCSTYYRIDSAYDTTADTYTANTYSKTDDDIYNSNARSNSGNKYHTSATKARKTATVHTPASSGQTAAQDNSFQRDRALTIGLLIGIVLTFVIPFFGVNIILWNKEQESCLSEPLTPTPASMGETISLYTEEYEYDLTIQSASIVTDACFQVPDGYQLVAFHYTLTEPDSPNSSFDMNRPDHTHGYDDFIPYLCTKSGEYLQAIDAYDLSKAYGDTDYEWRTTNGIGSDFNYLKGSVYFLVKENDIAGLLIQHTNNETTQLRASYQINDVEVTE